MWSLETGYQAFGLSSALSIILAMAEIGILLLAFMVVRRTISARQERIET
jgi:hypothetical protein